MKKIDIIIILLKRKGWAFSLWLRYELSHKHFLLFLNLLGACWISRFHLLLKVLFMSRTFWFLKYIFFVWADEASILPAICQCRNICSTFKQMIRWTIDYFLFAQLKETADSCQYFTCQSGSQRSSHCFHGAIKSYKS